MKLLSWNYRKFIQISLLTTIVLIGFLLAYCGEDNPAQPNAVTDIDGNEYQTVTIGEQVWMVENLKVTHYRNGEPIAHVTDSSAWTNTTSGAYCNYDNDTSNAAVYGRLYNWYAVDDDNNIAPEGWHVPSHAEWELLVDYLGGYEVAGGKIKEAGTEHWLDPNSGATNESGFTALPGGNRNYGHDFNVMGGYGGFWSSTERQEQHGSDDAINRSLSFGIPWIIPEYRPKDVGLSIRCIKD